jgi:hypothetical protein
MAAKGAESRYASRAMKMRTMRYLVLSLLAVTAAGVPGAAQSGCAGAIANFRAVIDSDAQTGNVNKSVYNRMLPEVERISAICHSGRDGEALRALQSLKSRYGYH